MTHPTAYLAEAHHEAATSLYARASHLRFWASVLRAVGLNRWACRARQCAEELESMARAEEEVLKELMKPETEPQTTP